jgi:hypothetical protein
MNSEMLSVAVVALYGTASDSAAVESWFQAAVRFMKRLGHGPDMLSISRSGKTGRWTSFDTGLRKLEKLGFHDVTDISLCRVRPGGTVPLHDYDILGSYSLSSRYALLACSESILPFSKPDWLELIQEMLKLSAAAYGVGYVRPASLGPVPYALGIAEGLGFSGAEYEEATLISTWGYSGMPERVYEAGLLRDVYPLNALSPSHLAKSVAGMPLRSWIEEANGKRGTLKSTTRDRWIWDLRGRELETLRAQLRANGCLFLG